MSLTIEREKVLEEIRLIPEDKLAEVYAILHYFRLGLETSRNRVQSVMQYAGCWQDMPDEVFAEFAQEIATRRQRAFSRRRVSEASLD